MALEEDIFGVWNVGILGPLACHDLYEFYEFHVRITIDRAPLTSRPAMR